MEEREAFVLTPSSAIVDSPEEAIRVLNISVSLLSAIVQDLLLTFEDGIDDDTIDAIGIVKQSTEGVNMYLERLGLWNSKD
ncbi:hypothetical protein KNV00_gp067 [Streptomyces phage Bmoc]|uniref:Uncharacterized protein n=1 Tax=Streptomyces phage Bmoc TaxID=2725629 RepID=A0A6M3T0Z0_9CAUD|nr:hypothetical protein KNV00_gp067 [Streptomyces phage Bmoc]QJD50952.1 hypothetical protein SEA_BMOC_244 [Streptomyces phage Bmoc]